MRQVSGSPDNSQSTRKLPGLGGSGERKLPVLLHGRPSGRNELHWHRLRIILSDRLFGVQCEAHEDGEASESRGRLIHNSHRHHFTVCTSCTIWEVRDAEEGGNSFKLVDCRPRHVSALDQAIQAYGVSGAIRTKLTTLYMLIQAA